MVRYEELDVAETSFQRLDWRLQVVFIGWSISVTVLVVGIKLLAMNAYVLSVAP